jgi:ABC-type transport system involved in multi-copper enzyme maturation permease subunit
MYRLFVIARHNFKQAVVQPIFTLLILFGLAVLFVFANLPFFTLGEDTRMFKTVSIDIILLLTLISTLMATSKSIYEEIEDRTMLTLMSKPLARWQVLVGKYLGLIGASGLSIAVLGLGMAASVWWRIPSDYLLRANSLNPGDIKQLADMRAMHLAGVWPSLVLMWLQVSVLAAISVAISTRVSFVVNLPAVILIYIAGNMARFIGAAVSDSNPLVRGIGWVIETILPFLQIFDLRQYTVFSTIRLPGTQFAEDTSPGAIFLSTVWASAGMATLYAVLYVTAALGVGLLSFRTRELGGAEG